MATALVGLGSNLDDRAAALSAAVARLAADPRITVLARSCAAEYASVGGPTGQPPYLNAAVLVRTDLAPQELWVALARIESELGRVRDLRWGPRTIDLDLLLYDQDLLETPQLTIPHPRLAVRRFVLEPAAEIVAEMVHPGIGWTIGRLLQHLRDHPRYVALAGPIGVGKTELARQIDAAVGRQLSAPCRVVEEPIDDEMLAQFYADPAGRGRLTELEFLRRRAPLLRGLEHQPPSNWTVSDFWFGQALAYGELWLKPEDRVTQRQRYDELAVAVTPPKLLVLLDAPPAELRRRIAVRGRPYELSLTDAVLDQLRQNIARVAADTHRGPVLKLSAIEPQSVVDEVTAAIAGMTV